MGEKFQVAAKKPEVKRENTASHTRNADQSQSMRSPVDQILYLQRTIGNQGVQRLIKSGALQAKLRIGLPGDKYEQEADRVADEVMRMSEPGGQRQVEPEEEEEEELQAKAISGHISETNPNLESHIQSLKGGGQPLSANERSFFEPRFSHDFSQVRVHSGTQAGEMAKGINAKAFTIGKNVVFGSGQYSPKTDEGKKLLAHELTHVIHQQSAALRIQQKTDEFILEPVRQNAEACLIHIHGNEKSALSAAQELYDKFCVNFMHIDSGRRHIKVDIPGKNFSCKADPNRIFDKDAISDKWESWNRNHKKCLISKKEAQEAVETYAKEKMKPKIKQCRAISGKIPVVVFHNNTDYDEKKTPEQQKKDLNIESYLPTGIYEDATETDESKDPLKSAIQELKNKPEKSKPKAPQTPPNPHRQDGKDKDNFILVTKGKDFVDLVRIGLNVVLQKQNITDDGSLSVALSSERYLNIEAQIGSKKQLGIGEKVLKEVMGISSIPCPKIQASSTGSPTVIIQFKTFPKKVSNQKERIKYLLGQFDPKKLGFKKVKIMKKDGYLRPEAAIAFEKMKKAAKKNNITLYLVSATRTFEDQKNIWNKKMVFDKSRKTFGRFEAQKSPVSEKCGAILTENDLKLKEWDTRNTNHRKCWNKLNDEDKSLEILKTSSAPGTSRHHWGTDIDLNSINPEDWEKTPLKEVHAWLTKNANTYGFYQAYTPISERGNKGYYEEKWHWSYRPIAEPLLKEYLKLFKDPKEFEKALKGKGVKASPFIISKYMEYASSVDILLKLSDKELEMIENSLKSIWAFLSSIRFLF